MTYNCNSVCLFFYLFGVSVPFLFPEALLSFSTRWRSGRTWPTCQRSSVRARKSWRETSPFPLSSSKNTCPSSKLSSRPPQTTPRGSTETESRGCFPSSSSDPILYLFMYLFVDSWNDRPCSPVQWCFRPNVRHCCDEIQVGMKWNIPSSSFHCRRHPCTVSEVFNFCWILFVHAKG